MTGIGVEGTGLLGDGPGVSSSFSSSPLRLLLVSGVMELEGI